MSPSRIASTTRSALFPSRRPTTRAATAPALRRQLTGCVEAPLDPGHDLLERARLVESPGLGDVPVVLADHALRGPRLARRGALVVEDADGGPVVDERVEEHRARVRDDRVRVLEQRREHVDVRVARLLDRSAGRGRARRRTASATRRRAGAAGRGARSGGRRPSRPTRRRAARRTDLRTACSWGCSPSP